MSTTDEDMVPVTEQEALAYLGPVAERLAIALLEGVMPTDRVGLAERIRESLQGDEGAVALLGAAFDAGTHDAALGELIAVARTDQSDSKVAAPDWSDVGVEGLRKAIAREDNICNRCANRGICVIARTAPPEMLTVLRRCLMFTE